MVPSQRFCTVSGESRQVLIPTTSAADSIEKLRDVMVSGPFTKTSHNICLSA